MDGPKIGVVVGPNDHGDLIFIGVVENPETKEPMGCSHDHESMQDAITCIMETWKDVLYNQKWAVQFMMGITRWIYHTETGAEMCHQGIRRSER